MIKRVESHSKASRTRALEQGMRKSCDLTGTGTAQARLNPARSPGRNRKSALQWYADRGALVEGDEEAGLNELRLYAGEALARLHDQAFRR